MPVVLYEKRVLPTDRRSRHIARVRRCREVRVSNEHVGDFVSGISGLESETVAVEIEALAELRALLRQAAAHHVSAELERVHAVQPRERIGGLPRTLSNAVL